ncbi:MAG: hypothetical protein L0271_02825 [Gemmatimonadetes bacterium]|nr:hypothetical protein [Gemmatimonadota bacterium]
MSASEKANMDAPARWRALSLVEQLAHVGSEVERSIRASEAGNDTRFEHALARALELFDRTAADDRWRGARRREILRAREEYCRLFFDPDVPRASAPGLRRYFLAFAVAARQP